MEKKIIHTTKAPEPIGPYNQATIAGNLVFVSGQIALDAETGNLITDDIAKETAKVLDNVGAVLEAAGSDFTQVVKASIFLSDMDLFQDVNKVYAGYFDSKNAPARECVAVKTLPKEVNVEISVISIIKSA